MHSTTFPLFHLPKSHSVWCRRRHSLLNSDSCHGDSPYWVFILCHRRFFLCTRFLFIYADKDRLYIKAGLCLGQVNPGNTIQFLALSLSLHNVFQGRNEQEHAVGEMQLLNGTVLKDLMFVSFKKKKKIQFLWWLQLRKYLFIKMCLCTFDNVYCRFDSVKPASVTAQVKFVLYEFG